MVLQSLKKPQTCIGLGLLLLLCIGCTLSLIFLPKQYVATNAFSTENSSNYHEISPDSTLIYTFTASSSFQRIGLLFSASVPHYPSGTLDIMISSSHQPDSLCQQSLEKLVDMTYVYCDYDGEAGQEYRLKITTTGNQLSYGFYIASSAKNPGTSFSINNEPKEAVIITTFLNEKPDYFIIWYYLMAAAIVVCFLILTVDKEAYASKKS